MISRNVFTELDEDPALVDGGQDEGEENLADQAGSHQEHDQVSLLDDPSHPRFVLDVLERHQQQHICRIIQLNIFEDSFNCCSILYVTMLLEVLTAQSQHCNESKSLIEPEHTLWYYKMF